MFDDVGLGSLVVMSGAASPTKTKSPSKSPTKAQQRAAAVADAARAAALVDAIKKEERYAPGCPTHSKLLPDQSAKTCTAAPGKSQEAHTGVTLPVSDI